MPPARARGRAASRQTAGNRRCEPRSRRETSSFPRRSTPWEASRSPPPGRNTTARRRSDRHSAPSATPSSGSRQLWHRRTMLSPLWFRLCRLRELGRLGHVEGRDLIVQRYSAEGHPSRYTDLAQDVVSLNPDVIFVTGNLLARIFRTWTGTLGTNTPIVATMSDPLETGM